MTRKTVDWHLAPGPDQALGSRAPGAGAVVGLLIAGIQLSWNPPKPPHFQQYNRATILFSISN